VNYDNLLVVIITVTSNLWAPSSGDIYLHVAPSTCRHTWLGHTFDLCLSYCTI